MANILGVLIERAADPWALQAATAVATAVAESTFRRLQLTELQHRMKNNRAVIHP